MWVFHAHCRTIPLTVNNSDIRSGEHASSRIRIKFWLYGSFIVIQTILQPLKYSISPHGVPLPKNLPLSNNKSLKALLRVLSLFQK